jgi:peroxiredoxin
MSVNRRKALIAPLATAMGFSALTGCSLSDSAPDSSFLLLDGSYINMGALKGKVILINFWATTCTTCVKEMPEIVKTYTKYQSKGFETVAVAMQNDPVNWVVNFTQTRQLPFKVALDNTGENAKQWGNIKITPTTFIVDKQGKIVKKYVGAPDFVALHALLESLLAEG